MSFHSLTTAERGQEERRVRDQRSRRRGRLPGAAGPTRQEVNNVLTMHFRNRSLVTQWSVTHPTRIPRALMLLGWHWSAAGHHGSVCHDRPHHRKGRCDDKAHPSHLQSQSHCPRPVRRLFILQSHIYRRREVTSASAEVFVGVVPMAADADVDGAIAHIHGIIGAKPFTVTLFRRFGDSIQTLIVLKNGRFSAPCESVPVGSEDPAPILEKIFGPGLPLSEIRFVEAIQVTGKTYAHGCLPPHWEAWVPSLVRYSSVYFRLL